MCGSSPKTPKAETPATLMTARDAQASSPSAANSSGRKQLRIDLNNATNSTPYGGSLVIPT